MSSLKLYLYYYDSKKQRQINLKIYAKNYSRIKISFVFWIDGCIPWNILLNEFLSNYGIQKVYVKTKTINSNFKVIFRNLQITYKYYFRKYPLIICWNKILHWWFCFSVVYLSQAISLLCSGSHIDSKHTSRNTCKLWVPRVTLKTVKGGMANIFKSTDIIVILIGRTSSPKMQLLKVASVLALNSFLSLSLFFFYYNQDRRIGWQLAWKNCLTCFVRQPS